MKQLTNCVLFISIWLGVPAITCAQSVYVTTLTDINFDDTRWVMEGFSITSADYATMAYYQPWSQTFIASNGIDGWGSGASYSGYTYVEQQVTPGVEYYAHTETYVDIYYYFIPYDYFGYYYTIDTPPYWINIWVWAPPIIYAIYYGALYQGSTYSQPITPTGTPCYYPNGEFSDWIGWYTGGYPTMYQAVFRGYLTDNGYTPPDGKYTGRTVTEDLSNFIDGCYAQYPYLGHQAATPVPGNPVTIDQYNSWGNDYIGSSYGWLNFWENAGVNDCAATIIQTMKMSACIGGPSLSYSSKNNGVMAIESTNPHKVRFWRGTSGNYMKEHNWPW
jgi:hypothetical protein